MLMFLTGGEGRYGLLLLAILLAVCLWGAATLKVFLYGCHVYQAWDEKEGNLLILLSFLMFIAPIIVLCLIDF